MSTEANELYKYLKEVNEENVYFEDDNGYGFLTANIKNNLLLTDRYENIIVTDEMFDDEHGNELIKIYIKNENAKQIILNHFVDNKDANFWECVLLIEDAFKKNKSDLLKFRGDLAEVIYLYEKGGEKYYEEESTDIIDAVGNSVEIKSFSPKTREVVISQSQAKNNVETFAVGIVVDDKNGMTMMQLIDGIVGNEKFKKDLKETYAKTKIANIRKYSVDHIENITMIVKNLNLNDMIIEARIRLF